LDAVVVAPALAQQPRSGRSIENVSVTATEWPITAAASRPTARRTARGASRAPEQNVVVQCPCEQASIEYLTSASYETQSDFGSDRCNVGFFFVEVDAASCNTDPTSVLTAPVTLISASRGCESYAVETGPNTGLCPHSTGCAHGRAVNRAVRFGRGILEVCQTTW